MGECLISVDGMPTIGVKEAALQSHVDRLTQAGRHVVVVRHCTDEPCAAAHTSSDHIAGNSPPAISEMTASAPPGDGEQPPPKRRGRPPKPKPQAE